MSDTKEEVKQIVEEAGETLRSISRWMYENPELAYQEHRSSARLVQFLREAGFDVEYPAYGLETSFAARRGGFGPHVVVCAEYDALPGVGHACGHNIIATAALGAGAALVDMVDRLGIRLTILGTPAEENYGGKVDLIEAGAFEGVDAAMMIHPSPIDVVDPRVIAVSHLDVHYHGKAAHASAYPQHGINALDAAVQAYVNVSALRQHLYPTDKVHGIIAQGGDAPNIIPEYTRSSWYVRAENRRRLDELTPKVTACFQGAATATGCSVDIEKVGHVYDELISNPVLVELYANNSAALGRRMMRGDELPPSQSGSTDMGNVSKLVPSIHPMLAIDCLPAVNHQKEFAAHTITSRGEQAIDEDTPEDEADPEPVGEPTAPPVRSADFPRRDGDVVRLREARLLLHDGFDRFVLELDGAPSWRVESSDGPVVEQPGGTEVDLRGGTHLEVRVTPATSVDPQAREPTDGYEGPTSIEAEGSAVLEATMTSDFDDVVVWSLGLDDDATVAVSLLEDPDRLVVDVVAS